VAWVTPLRQVIVPLTLPSLIILDEPRLSAGGRGSFLVPAYQYLCEGRRFIKRAIRFFFISSAALLILTIAKSAQGQTGDTQVTLSCNDGHSVTAALDPTTLLELTAEVQALTSDPTGLNCTLDPAATPPTSWTVYDYNPSSQAIAPRVSAASMPGRQRMAPPHSHSNPTSIPRCSRPLRTV
jgi:hypothetical protein